MPVGLQEQSFDIATSPALSQTSVAIWATTNATRKSKALVVTPASIVAPTSLNFGELNLRSGDFPVATLKATLSNVGALPFSVGPITFVHPWFQHTEYCPSILPAGRSCTISVSFRPQFPGRYSAKLSIATGARSVPLVVTLSGTASGIPF